MQEKDLVHMFGGKGFTDGTTFSNAQDINLLLLQA